MVLCHVAENVLGASHLNSSQSKWLPSTTVLFHIEGIKWCNNKITKHHPCPACLEGQKEAWGGLLQKEKSWLPGFVPIFLERVLSKWARMPARLKGAHF